jgi:hypothetical protein
MAVCKRPVPDPRQSFLRERASRLSRPGEDGGQGERFLKVDGSLHNPPTGYTLSDSFKTTENYGNLQLTFFASTKTPLEFRIDSDIDDAGIGHVFQVLHNWLTGSQTHPYDIHQILAFHQALKPQYDLSV